MAEREIRASVAMAVYNGAEYLRDQIESVVLSMNENDELVISYDQSTDSSLEIIQEYTKKDSRVKLSYNNRNNAGIAGNFNNAINNCKGKYVFLCDQDDYWKENKIERVVEEFEKTQANLVVHDGLVVDDQLQSMNRTLHSGIRITTNPIANFIKGRFWGCCMAFDRKALNNIMPFPQKKNGIPHDIFATIIVGFKGKISVIDDILIYHRLHQRNETPQKRRKLTQIVPDRIELMVCILDRLFRTK